VVELREVVNAQLAAFREMMMLGSIPRMDAEERGSGKRET
jgi:hypothetical protein